MAYPVADSYSCAAGGVIAGGRSLSAASGIAITDTVYQRVFQRVGTSKSIPVSGTYTGTASLIQARACPAGTATNALESTYPWSSIAALPSGGTFSGNLSVPQGDGWIVQVRDGVDPAVAASGTNSFGVGVFVALIGQSNMENMFGNVLHYPLGAPGAYSGRNASTGAPVIIRLGNIEDTAPPGTWADGASGYQTAAWPDPNTHEDGCNWSDGLVYAGNRMRAGLGIPVVLLPYAASGTSMAHWTPGNPSEYYASAMFAGIDALGGDFEAAIWLQGENDGITLSVPNYQTALETLLAACKSHTGRSASNFHFGVTVVGPATAAWLGAGHMAPIRKSQLDFVAANAGNGAFLAGTDVDGNLNGGAVHIDQASLFRQGYRYGEAIVRRLSGAAHGIEGPKVGSATRSGAVVTVAIQHNGGTALLDGAGGSGSALLGFRVYDGATLCTISSTAISGSNIVLTLSATPAGAVTLDYAMDDAPFTATRSLASVVYDDQTVPGDTLGLPLQPCPTITVT